MELKKLWKVFEILNSLKKKEGEVTTVNQLLEELKKEFNEEAEEIFNELRLTGVIRLGINKKYNPTWDLTNRGKRKYTFIKYLFSPDDNQKNQKRENNEILNNLLKAYFLIPDNK